MSDLTSQWGTQDGKERAEEIFGRLLAGSRLDDLRLGEHDGRVDLRGIGAPSPERLKTLEKNGWVVAELGGLLKFESVKLADLDFSFLAVSEQAGPEIAGVVSEPAMWTCARHSESGGHRAPELVAGTTHSCV
jgi:hypothetical protein